jgi:hypothetical protein
VTDSGKTGKATDMQSVKIEAGQTGGKQGQRKKDGRNRLMSNKANKIGTDTR